MGPLWRWDSNTQQWYRIDPTNYDTIYLQPTWGLWLNSFADTWIAP
jgi:hypothetical protein